MYICISGAFTEAYLTLLTPIEKHYMYPMSGLYEKCYIPTCSVLFLITDSHCNLHDGIASIPWDKPPAISVMTSLFTLSVIVTTAPTGNTSPQRLRSRDIVSQKYLLNLIFDLRHSHDQ